MGEDAPPDLEGLFTDLFNQVDRDAPATKGDVWDKGRDLRALKLQIEQDLNDQSRWVRYNTKLAEGAWSMASSAMILLWGGGAFALVRLEGFSTFWCWCAAMLAGGYSWYSAKSFRPVRPAE